MKHTKWILFVMLTLLANIATAQPTDRHFIKQRIKEWGSCRTVAITRTGGDLAISGKNTFASNGIPDELYNKLKSLKEQGSYIDDVILTEKGCWIVLYDKNDATWSAGIPIALRDAILDFHKKDYYVRSILFNDDMKWVIVAKEQFLTSDAEMTAYLKEKSEQYGALWSVTLGENGEYFAVYESGFAKQGTFQEDLMDAIRNTDLDYYRVKFAGASWFFADEDGEYKFSM